MAYKAAGTHEYGAKFLMNNMEEVYIMKVSEAARKPERYKRLGYYNSEFRADDMLAFTTSEPRVYYRNGKYFVYPYDMCVHFSFENGKIPKKQKLNSMLESGRLVQVNGYLFVCRGGALTTLEMIELGMEPAFTNVHRITKYAPIKAGIKKPESTMSFDLKKLPGFGDIWALKNYFSVNYGIHPNDVILKGRFVDILSWHSRYMWNGSFSKYMRKCKMKKRHPMYGNAFIKKLLQAISRKNRIPVFAMVNYGIYGGIAVPDDEKYIERLVSQDVIGVLPDGTFVITESSLRNRGYHVDSSSGENSIPFERFDIKLSEKRRLHVRPKEDFIEGKYVKDKLGVFAKDSEDDIYFFYDKTEDKYPTGIAGKCCWKSENVDDLSAAAWNALKMFNSPSMIPISRNKEHLLNVLEIGKTMDGNFTNVNSLLKPSELNDIPKNLFKAAVLERWPERVYSVKTKDEIKQFIFEPCKITLDDIKDTSYVRAMAKILELFDPVDVACRLVASEA